MLREKYLEEDCYNICTDEVILRGGKMWNIK